MIKKDAFNNSAWNHLFFVVEHVALKTEGEERIKFMSRFVNFALENIEEHKGNRAIWNFLRGLFPSIKLKPFTPQNSEKRLLIPSYDECSQIYDYCQKGWNEAQMNT